MIVSLPVFLRGDSGNNVLQVLFGAFAEAESKNCSESLDDDECADNYGYHSDSDLEEDEDSVENKPKPTYGEYTECLQKGKVVKIQDMAFVT